MTPGWNHKLHGLRWPALFPEAPQELMPAIAEARALGERLIRGPIGAPEGRAIEQVAASFRLTVESVREGVVRIRIGGHSEADTATLPELPTGYGFKGGAARTVLGALLGRGAFPPRDMDLLRFGHGWTELDTAVSRQIMGRDFDRGDGVEVSPSPSRYFSSRDLSCNEILVMDGELQMTAVGFADTLGAVLRPCRYRGGSTRRPPRLSGRTAAKMLRLRAEGIVCGVPWLVVGVPSTQELGDMDIAIHLSRALERGPAVAEELLRQLHHVGIRGEDGEPLDLRTAAEELGPLLSADSLLAMWLKE